MTGESMDRLIREQVVIDRLSHWYSDMLETGKEQEDLIEVIKAIPSAEPKTAHWIADIDRWGDVITTVNGYRCDKCNAFDSDKDNYCPNCGAKMAESEDKE